MKLLDKKEIVQQKSLERKTEIDEGIKLARKIDTLRETAAKEEANLTKFREESLKRLKIEVSGLDVVKQNLLSEIEQLQNTRSQLLIPLDKEWEKVREKQVANDAFETVLDEKATYLTEQEKIIAHKNKELTTEEDRINDKKEEINKLAKVIEDKAKEAERIFTESKQKEQQVNEIAIERENTLNIREAAIAVREQEILLIKESLQKREKELNDRERLVNDKYQTLLRTQKYVDNSTEKHGK